MDAFLNFQIMNNMDKLTNIYWWKNQYYNLCAWINPRQKWLTKKIPNRFCDKVELIPLVLFEILVNFVEDEDGLESIWGNRYLNEEYSEDYRKIREPIRKELEEIYEYIKTDRARLEKELDESYPKAINGGDLFDHLEEDDSNGKKMYKLKSCEEIYGMSYEEAYCEVRRLEALIEERDTWAMTGIIKHRDYLWT